ncbi:hypothetical protein FO519_003892 [Halicephalobus sp. NKZ332]|nr:hypothetical protein FO519_003892 [Halicephalobus sp. NKZ332]
MLRLLLPSVSRLLLRPQLVFPTTSRSYAAPVGGKVVPVKEDKSFIEEDAEKLCKYVCEEPGPKILPDSEYPEWLFQLDLSPPKQLEDLDPEVDGWKYWEAVMKRRREQVVRHEKLKIKFLHMQDSPSMSKVKNPQEES